MSAISSYGARWTIHVCCILNLEFLELSPNALVIFLFMKIKCY